MKKNSPRFPLFVDLTDKKIVVVGAGHIAARRVRTLCQFSGEITVVAPHVRRSWLWPGKDRSGLRNVLTAGRTSTMPGWWWQPPMTRR